MVRAALAELHQRLVHGDAHQPGVKAGVALEFAEVLVSLQKGFLHGVFGVFAILGDVLGEAENFALVAADEGFEGADVAGFGGGDEDRLVFLHDGGRKLGARLGRGFGLGSLQGIQLRCAHVCFEPSILAQMARGPFPRA